MYNDDDNNNNVSPGSIHCIFEKSNNHYTWKKVNTTVHNIIVGKLWIDQVRSSLSPGDTAVKPVCVRESVRPPPGGGVKPGILFQYCSDACMCVCHCTTNSLIKLLDYKPHLHRCRPSPVSTVT